MTAGQDTAPAVRPGLTYTGLLSQNILEQAPEADYGLAAVVHIARFHLLEADASQLRHAAGSSKSLLSIAEISAAAQRVGLKTRIAKTDAARLAYIPVPALLLNSGNAHLILIGCSGDEGMVLDPVQGRMATMPVKAISAVADLGVMLFASRASLVGELAKFDISWFIPSIVRHRWILLQVLGVSFVIQLLGLALPLMYQVVMDKVLVNRAFNTLNVVLLTLISASILETVLTTLRNYVFSHTTNRIDVELGAKLFKHLVELPLRYFGSRRVGDTVARVRELENIRSFITGQSLTVILDISFSFVFFGVMWIYSPKLTLLVLASLPMYIIVSTTVIPVLRDRLNQKFKRGADNQSFLVETVTAAETVKSMAVEPQFITQWNTQLASYVSASFRVSNMGNAGQQAVGLIGKFVNLGILYIGAQLVIENRMTVGQLVAFNMLAQHVSAPIMRLASLWQEFQQVGVSMRRMSDVLDTKTESPHGAQRAWKVKGQISFSRVNFRYRPGAATVLQDISFNVPAGSYCAIIGRSGSGKSTLTKLIQKLYLPESGQIFLDGVDIGLLEPSSLRRQIGVVLQDNVLFNRTIRANIALVDPGRRIEDVIVAARLAGAHDFIMAMPEGYNTSISEGGSNLSGGQRQRIAIARALFGDPSILIFDEATSALDFETEQIVRDNMKAIRKGRTVLVVTHRISSIREADVILAFENGRLVEQGTHAQLMGADSVYRRMAQHQTAAETGAV